MINSIESRQHMIIHVELATPSMMIEASFLAMELINQSHANSKNYMKDFEASKHQELASLLILRYCGKIYIKS